MNVDVESLKKKSRLVYDFFGSKSSEPLYGTCYHINVKDGEYTGEVTCEECTLDINGDIITGNTYFLDTDHPSDLEDFDMISFSDGDVEGERYQSFDFNVLDGKFRGIIHLKNQTVSSSADLEKIVTSIYRQEFEVPVEDGKMYAIVITTNTMAPPVVYLMKKKPWGTIESVIENSFYCSLEAEITLKTHEEKIYLETRLGKSLSYEDKFSSFIALLNEEKVEHDEDGNLLYYRFKNDEVGMDKEFKDSSFYMCGHKIPDIKDYNRLLITMGIDKYEKVDDKIEDILPFNFDHGTNHINEVYCVDDKDIKYYCCTNYEEFYYRHSNCLEEFIIFSDGMIMVKKDIRYYDNDEDFNYNSYSNIIIYRASGSICYNVGIYRLSDGYMIENIIDGIKFRTDKDENLLMYFSEFINFDISSGLKNIRFDSSIFSIKDKEFILRDKYGIPYIYKNPYINE